MAERMITAEILKPCVVCCQPGSIVEVTETQFRFLGDVARPLDNDAPIPYKIVDTFTFQPNPPQEDGTNAAESAVTASNAAESVPAAEVVENAVENAPEESPEAGKKSKRRKA